MALKKNVNQAGESCIGQSYTYDAFISYRHTELDKFVAETLHKQMEAFRLPRKIADKKSGGRTRIERVFRDRDELPLTNNLEDPIRIALEKSEYLIVICSPRLRESLWCKKEIETFMELHGRHKILAVLVEGEPHESFPEELLGWKEEVTHADGSVEIVEHRMEPLAADVRGKNKRAIKKAMKTEILRLLAPMFQLNYDDLRQRHRERRMKRILGASVAVAAVCLAFGAVSTTMALRISSQNQQITSQNEQITAQNQQITSQNQELIANQEQIRKQNEQLMRNQALNLAEDSLALLESGDRVGAMDKAINALTEYDGLPMPYTAKAQYALTEAMHIYDCKKNLKALYQVETKALISFAGEAPDEESFFTFDGADGLVLWDVKSGRKIRQLPDSAQNSEYSCAFLGDKKLAYLDGKHHLMVYDIASDEIKESAVSDYTYYLNASRDGNYIIAGSAANVWVVDGKNPDEVIFRDTLPEGGSIRTMEFHSEDSGVVSYSYRLDDGAYVRFADLREQRVLSEQALGDYFVEQVRCKEDTAWILASCFEGDTINMDSSLWACDLRTGANLWRQDFDRKGTFLRRPYAEGAEHLQVVSGSECYLIRMDDGSIALRDPVGDTVAATFSLSNSDSFLIFTRGGEYELLMVSQMTSAARPGFFECHSANIKTVLPVVGGYMILPYQDNKMTMYGYSDLSDAENTDEAIPEELSKPIEYSAARELAAEAGLPKADLVQTVFYDPEETLCFVYYGDGTLEIYDRESMKCQATLENMWEYIRYCFGRDDAGHLYVGSLSYGYMLNEDYEILARIEGLQYVNREGNYLLLSSISDRNLKVPIYTAEELLAKARDYVIKFE